jgi:anti-anti-sigma factor
MLDLSIDRQGPATMVSLKGELDISEVNRVQQELLSAEAAHPPVLVIDLRELTFIDSSGLRLVIEADLRGRREGRRLVVVPGPEQVHRIFLVALLDKRLEFVDDPATLPSADEARG